MHTTQPTDRTTARVRPPAPARRVALALLGRDAARGIGRVSPLGIAALLASVPAHAQSSRLAALTAGVVDTVVYSFVGIVMAAIGFKVVDWLTPGSLAEDIAHKENRALAILVGAMILGICIIIAGVINEA